MKTMKLGDSVIRVKDEEVKKKLSDGYSYCPKGEWKKIHGRKAVLKEKAEEVVQKKEERSAKLKEKANGKG